MSSPYQNPFELRSEMATKDASTDLSLLLTNWFQRHGPMGTYRTCASCRFMPQVGPAVCQKFEQTPPIGTIMRGCTEYADVLPTTAKEKRDAERAARGLTPIDDDDIPF